MTKTANSNGCPKLTVAEQQAVLRNLNQQAAAWLIDKPADWLRNNARLFDRTSGGRYDARDLLAHVASSANDITPAHLDDAHYEVLEQVLYSPISNNEGCQTGFVRVLNEIQAAHGIAGLAAIGQFVKESTEQYLAAHPHHERDQTEADIRAEYTQRMEKEIANIPWMKAATDMRTLVVCSRCKKFRWGRLWREPPLPQGYFAREGNAECNPCLGKTY